MSFYLLLRFLGGFLVHTVWGGVFPYLPCLASGVRSLAVTVGACEGLRGGSGVAAGPGAVAAGGFLPVQRLTGLGGLDNPWLGLCSASSGSLGTWHPLLAPGWKVAAGFRGQIGGCLLGALEALGRGGG